MKLSSIGMIAASLVLATLAPQVLAGTNCKPVTGHFEASLIAPGTGHCPAAATFCTAGRVWGGLQGDYQFVMAGATPSAPLGGVPTILFFTGASDVSVTGGDHLFGTDTGSIDLPPGRGGFASLITFTGGTGAMADANGQIALRGQFDPVAGTTRGDYSGEICTAP